MPNASKFYLEHIYNVTSGFHATWYPNAKLNLGDIVITDDFGSQVRQTSLQQENILFEENISDSASDMDFSSGSGVTISAKINGEAPVIGSLLSQADAGFNIQFNNDRSLVFKAAGCKTRQITNLREVEKAVIEKNDNGDWNKKYLIITQLVEAEAATVIIADKGGVSVDLKARAAIGTDKIKITDAGLDAVVGRTTGDTQQFITRGTSTPLYKAMALNSSWLGKKSLEVRDVETPKLVAYNPLDNGKPTAPAGSNIYAVLVGINEYAAPNQLKGCVNDIKAVEGWLNDTFGNAGRLNIRRLTDEDPGSLPTRENIIAAFDHFSSAKDDDICLFYYCGHGTNLSDPPLFASGMGTNVVQALVCRDVDPGNRYLVDKELSYLIWKATYNKPSLNFIAITDCCHSGTITRDVEDEETAISFRTLTTADASPAIETYAGYSETINGENAYTKIPGAGPGDPDIYSVKIGNHIHIGAALDTQTAGEKKINDERRGAFTYALVESLKQNNRQSYLQVLDAAKAAVKNLYTKNLVVTHEQTPVININGNMSLSGMDKVFLSNEYLAAKTEFDLFNDQQYGWCLRAGILDGITTLNTVQVKLANASVTLAVKKVNLEFSILEDSALLDKTTTPKGTVTGLLRNPLALSFSKDFPGESKDKIIALIGGVLNRTTLTSFNRIEFPNGTGAADFELYPVNEDHFGVRAAGTGKAVNQTMPADGDRTMVEALLTALTKLNTWQYLSGLSNNINPLQPAAYKLHLQVSNGSDSNGNYLFKDADFQQENMVSYAGKKQPAFRLQVESSATDSLYVTGAYLDADYGIYTNLLEPLQVEPGKRQSLILKNEGDTIQLSNKNNEPITEYLKLFISNKAPVFLGTLEQAPVANRGIGAEEEEPDNTDGQWQTETIAFVIAPKPVT